MFLFYFFLKKEFIWTYTNLIPDYDTFVNYPLFKIPVRHHKSIPLSILYSNKIIFLSFSYTATITDAPTKPATPPKPKFVSMNPFDSDPEMVCIT